MNRIIRTKHYTVEFEDTIELRDRVFEAVLEFYVDYQAFDGDAIMQSDDPQIYAPVVLSEIADDLFRFNVK